MMILRKPTVVPLLSMDIILQVLQGTSPQVVVLIALGLGAASQQNAAKCRSSPVKFLCFDCAPFHF